MELFCRNRGRCRWNHSWRTLLITAWLGVWAQRASSQGSAADVITAKVGATVVIRNPVPGVIITYTWYRGTAVSGDQAILSYQGPSTPPLRGPQYTGRESVLPDRSLQITDVQPNYTGNYTGLIQVAGAPATTFTRQLKVYEPVSTPDIHPDPLNPIENRSLTLSCNASGTAVSYQWYRAGTVVVSEGHISLSANNQILTLSPCSKSDTGTSFTCRASNAVSNSSSRPYNVTISYGPETPVISVSPEEQFYAEGSALTLSCSVESYPPALYTWLHNGKSIVGQNITINSLIISDSGNYTCNTTSNVTHLSNSATREIFVLELVPKPTVSINVSQPIENQPVALTCGNSNSATTILWFFNKSPLQPDSNRMSLSADNRTLTIAKLSQSDDGSYQCEVQNPVSSSTSDPLTVTVSYGPERLEIRPSQNVEVKLGTELRLTCTAASYPAAQYQWLHNNININNSQNMYTKTSSAFEDSGNYTCVASNRATGLSANVTAIVKISATGIPCSCWQATLGVAIGVFLCAIAVIAGVVFYYKRLRTQMETWKGDVTYQNHGIIQKSETQYENTKKEHNRHLANPPTGTDSTYMELQHGDQATYEQIKR